MSSNILIVEDSLILSISLADSLRLLGYEVMEPLTSGEEALQCVQSQCPDLILMDIELGGSLSGIDTRKRMLELGLDVPTIFITGHLDEYQLQRAALTNPLGYLLKPWKQLQLEVTLQLAVGKLQAEKKLAALQQQAAISKETLEVASSDEFLSRLTARIPPQLLHSILEPSDNSLEASRRKVSILFCDIPSFSELTDRLEATQLVELLNGYYRAMGLLALKRGGQVKRVSGDMITVFFGAPISLGLREDALACVETALEMRDHLQELRRDWEKYGIAKMLRLRFGISTGYCVFGMLGAEQLRHYSLLGYPLRIAQQLGKRAEPGQILLSADTQTLVKNKIICTTQEELAVQGLSSPVSTFQVVDRLENLLVDPKTHQYFLQLEECMNTLPPTEFSEQELEVILQKIKARLSSGA